MPNSGSTKGCSQASSKGGYRAFYCLTLGLEAVIRPITTPTGCFLASRREKNLIVQDENRRGELRSSAYASEAGRRSDLQ